MDTAVKPRYDNFYPL
ncbi:hypothetical protein ABVF33_05540 [Candidatus Rickettsia barbariae]|nr:hypothetical protein FEC77_01020 [Rickettsia parkeri]HJD54741.1 hypothetical protein [Rickettsia endosymbiont of Proechinophthirus fluctus]